MSVTGGPRLSTTFRNLYSYELDGSDDFIKSVTSFNSLPSSEDYFSTSVWFKADSLLSNHYIYHITDASNNLVTYLLLQSTGRLQAFTAGSSSNWTRSAVGAIVAGQWYHLSVVYDNTVNRYSKQKIYINSSRDGVISNFFNGAFNDSDTLRLGVNSVEGSNFSGTIDEFAFWPGHAFTASEVDGVYNGATPSNLDEFSTPPQNWWRMGEDSIWDGSKWVIPYKMWTSISLNTFNMSESSRVSDTP